MDNYLIISFFIFLGGLVAAVAISVSRLLSFRTIESEKKRDAYECGAELFSDARIKFKVGYYLFALLFLVFDIEALFLFPCVRIFKDIALGKIPGLTLPALFAELTIFVFILFLGLIYAWRKGALEWD